MNYRHVSRLVEWAVVAAVVALHALIAIQSRLHPEIGWLQIGGDAQPIALVSLLLAWGLLGPGRLWLRAVAVPILFIAWAVAVSGGDRRLFNPADSQLPLPFAIAIAIGLVLGVARLCGLRMIGIPEGQPEPRPQFSIFALLTATTLIAATIGGLELLRPTILIAERDAIYSFFDELVLLISPIGADVTNGSFEISRGMVPSPATVRQWVLSLAIAGAATGGLATVLRPGAVWLRLAIVAAALPAMGVYLTHLASTSNDEFAARSTELTMAFAAVAGLVGISVLPLRLMGYRMFRSPIAATSGRAAPCMAGTSPSQSDLRHPETQHAHASVQRGTP